MTTLDILKRTKAAWPSICNASAEDKNRILSAMADSLQAQCDAILRCNAEDMDAARGHISDVMLDRLYLDRGRVDAMADGIRATVALPDHTGRILAQIDHPNGMKIYKKQVPLGLVAIIYESPAERHVRRGGARHKERQRLYAPQRQGGLPHGQGHRRGAQAGHCLRRR